jgi:hypothetical protein
MSELPEVALEIRTAREVALPLYPDSYEGPLLRVKYRPVGTRRWTSFLLVPEEGEHYHALEMRAADAVAAHRRQLRTTVAGNPPPPESDPCGVETGPGKEHGDAGDSGAVVVEKGSDV